MNCERFESVVNDLARRQIIETNAREQALAHCQECHSCSVRLQDERLLTQGLRELATEMESAESPDRTEKHLRVAFRNRRFAEPRRVAATRRWYWLTAAAAILLIAFGLAALRLRQTPSVHRAPETRQTNNAGIGSESPTSVVATSSLSKKTPDMTASSKRKASPLIVHSQASGARNENVATKQAETAVADSTEREIATDFLPVGYTSSMNLQDGGQIVRVELPRSTLATFGLPVNMDRYHERVKADVLFGADGQARAIRFVQ